MSNRLVRKIADWKNSCCVGLLCVAGIASTASASSLSQMGLFDGATGVLTSCVVLYSDEGSILVNAEGAQERYQIELGLVPDTSATDTFTFNLNSAAPSTAENCSGRYQSGAFTDSVLVENAGASLAGKIYALTMQQGSGPNISFVLQANGSNFSVARDLATNSIAFGAQLGSFQTSSQLAFNTVNVPSFYPLQAPQCSDADGDTAEVLVEIAGQVVQRTAPGKEFLLNTSSMAVGSTEVRVRCSDITALTSRQGSESFGKATEHAAGVVTLAVAADPNCTTTIDSYLQKLTETFPTWEQLDCFTPALVRRANPDFYLLASDTPPEEFSSEARQTFIETVQSDVMFDLAWPESVLTSANLSDAPPFLINGAVAYTDLEWDQKQRGMATFGIYMKQLGKRLEFNFFYPPSTGEPGAGRVPVTQNSEEFLSWWQTVYIPERVALAKVAERIKAEYYQPWDIEPGQFVRAMGDVWLSGLSEAEQVSVAQQAIDLLHAAVRPEFTGTLTIINYDRYAAHGDHWKQQNLSAWDQVHFALFTEGDVEATERYLQEQLSGYLEIVQRDNLSNWVLSETTVNPATHQRLLDQANEVVQFATIENQIYQALFTAIENLSVAPKGLTLTAGNIIGSDTEALVRSKFAALLKAN